VRLVSALITGSVRDVVVGRRQRAPDRQAQRRIEVSHVGGRDRIGYLA